jgi:CheY-like chemotaxis protein
MHDGSVSAHSQGPGAGTEFIIRLPAAIQVPDISRIMSATETARGIPSHRILIVDDNVDSAATLGMLLKYLGADVHVAHDGLAALSAMENCLPDIVLLDIGMPEMDGFEVARRIRQREEFHHVTLIALTGWGQEDDRRRTREAGFDHHLVKPADIVALQALLATLD